MFASVNDQSEMSLFSPADNTELLQSGLLRCTGSDTLRTKILCSKIYQTNQICLIQCLLYFFLLKFDEVIIHHCTEE